MNYLLFAVAALVAAFLLKKVYPYLYFFFQSLCVFFRMDLSGKTEFCLPDDVKEVRDSHVSAWFIKCREGYIAVDTGQHVGAIRESLRKLGIDRMKVKTILLTHTDSDHIGSVKFFPNAQVFIAEAEQPMVDGTGCRTFSRYRLSFGGNKLKVQWKTLRDGEILRVSGREIHCILTPGHTPGSMCFLVDGKYLFTGDALSLEKGRFQQFIPLYTMDIEESTRSISKLITDIGNQPVEYIFTGHHRFSSDFSRASEGWR